MADQLTGRDKNTIHKITVNEDAGTGKRVIDLLEAAGSAVQSVTGASVDNTDPANPIINAVPPSDGWILKPQVTWLQNYDYAVSAGDYIINGVTYHTDPVDLITLSPSDLSDDRIDLFVVTTSETVEIIEGDPATPALEPDVDPATQLKFGFALVAAGSTEPTLSTESIYLENTEWVTSVSNPTINPASANNPFEGTVDIEGTAVANGHFIDFTPASFPSLPSLGAPNLDFIFKIRSKAIWNSPSRLVFRFFNGNTAIGNAVQIGNNANIYGFVSSVLGSYQNINIPIVDFGNISAATKLRISKTGGGTIGFYIDKIQLVQSNSIITSTQIQSNWTQTNASAPDFILNKPVEPKLYIANLTQTGITAPVLTVMLNTLGATVSSAYSAVGEYQLVASSTVFVNGKTTVLINNNRDDSGNSKVNTSILSTSTVIISTQDTTTTPTDGILVNCTIRIEVYPS